MSTADIQILDTDVAAVPKDYTIPAVKEFQPLAVRAIIDGSGAAGSFIPVMTVLGTSGQIISQVPTDTTLAAGDVAEVTWAPFLRQRAQAAAAAGAAEMTWAYINTSHTLANNTTATWDVVGYHPAGQTSFSWDGPKQILSFLKRGIYLMFVFWNSSFASGKFVQAQLFISGQTFFTPGFNLQNNNTNPNDHQLIGAVPQLYPVTAAGGATAKVIITTNNVGGTNTIDCSFQAVYLSA